MPAWRGAFASELGRGALEVLRRRDDMGDELEDEAAALAGEEERVKGYRVKTSFSPVREGEKKAKRDAVAKVILGAIKRRKKEKKDEKDEKDE